MNQKPKPGKATNHGSHGISACMYCSEDSCCGAYFMAQISQLKKRSSIRNERNISVQWTSMISWSLKLSFCPTLKLAILQIGLCILKIWQTWKKHFFFIQERLVSVRVCLPLLVTWRLLRVYRIGTKKLTFTVRAMSKLLVFLQADSLHLIFIWNVFLFHVWPRVVLRVCECNNWIGKLMPFEDF